MISPDDLHHGIPGPLTHRETVDHASDEREIPAAECRQCHGDSKVIRTTETDGPIVRRRQCLVCGWRWNTREYPDED